ncbi:MAG: amidase, partial [Lachnospiraceae bacterium]|nr:amidase [Lachnospiraceae bacterium]
GGSSGGSAVATSLNFVTASVGTDTNSSLRYPAALNGCVSLRATRGLISRDGIIKLNGARDTAGAITRTVKDQAIMLDVLTGGKTSYADNLNAGVLQGMRIGILKELTYPVDGKYNRTNRAIDDEIEVIFANAVKELEKCGAVVVEVSLPDIFDMSEACDENYEGYKEAKNVYYAAFKALLADNNISAVIFPTYLSAPLYTGVNSSGGLRIYDQIWTSNCSVLSSPIGIPEISVPIGQHSRGAGIGMEIASLKNSEQLLLDMAYSYTEKYNHRAVPNTAPNLYVEYDAGNLEDFIARYKEALVEIERLKEEEQREQETTTQEIETTTEQETATEPETTTEPEVTTAATADTATTMEVTTTLTATTTLKETSTPVVETSTFMKDVFADYNADEDNLGKILWIIFIMLIVLVAVANFIILYHEDDKKRRKK